MNTYLIKLTLRKLTFSSESLWLYILLPVIISIAFFACKKDKQTQMELTTDEIKSWYVTHANNFNTESKIFENIKPDFTNSFSAIKDGLLVTEFNFDQPNKLVFDDGVSTEAEKEIALTKTEIRMLFFNPVKTKSISGSAFMVIVGKEKEDLEKVHYKEFRNFSGRILFYNGNGSLENGYHIDNGKVVNSFAKVKLNANELLSLKTSFKNKPGIRNLNGGSKLMLADVNSNCFEWVVTSEQTCFSFDLYQFNKTMMKGSQQQKIMAGSGDYCRWMTSGEYVGSDCQGSGNDGGYSGGAGNTGGQQGGGSGGGNTINKDIIDSLRGYPCAQALLAKMKTPINTDIGNLIKNTFAKNDLVNITFSADRNLAGTNTDGAEQTGNNSKLTAEFFIGLNPDILKNSSQEYILVTMYHEALHAFFGRKLQTLGVVEFNRQYEGINVSGGRLLGVNNDAHIPMAYQNYVKGLKDIIMAFNPNFNEDRAWILAKTGIIQNLPEESKINDQERDTTKPGYTGTKCP